MNQALVSTIKLDLSDIFYNMDNMNKSYYKLLGSMQKICRFVLTTKL